VRKEAEKRKIAKEEKKKKMLEYLQQLWVKVLVEDATLLEGTGDFQITRTKCKENTSENKEEQQPSKKAKGKQLRRYYGNIRVKMEGSNLYERCVYAEQDCLVHNSR